MLEEGIEHLRHAEKIVIIGYSAPSSAQYFRYILAEALAGPAPVCIEVWDIRKEAEIRASLDSLFGRRTADWPNLMYSDEGMLGFVRSHDSRSELVPGGDSHKTPASTNGKAEAGNGP